MAEGLQYPATDPTIQHNVAEDILLKLAQKIMENPLVYSVPHHFFTPPALSFITYGRLITFPRNSPPTTLVDQKSYHFSEVITFRSITYGGFYCSVHFFCCVTLLVEDLVNILVLIKLNLRIYLISSQKPT